MTAKSLKNNNKN